MSIADEIRAEVKGIFKSGWTERDGNVVPEAEDLRLGNDAVKLSGAVLYADLAESTAMVNRKNSKFAAEVYKTFLISACRIIRHRGGEITSFDGDRVMAVFLGNRMLTAVENGGAGIVSRRLKVVARQEAHWKVRRCERSSHLLHLRRESPECVPIWKYGRKFVGEC